MGNAIKEHRGDATTPADLEHPQGLGFSQIVRVRVGVRSGVGLAWTTVKYVS